jgi:hypothetical protein
MEGKEAKFKGKIIKFSYKAQLASYKDDAVIVKSIRHEMTVEDLILPV